MKHIVYFSGGVGSWACAKRVAAIHGTKNLVLVFADTLIEDRDLYRFIHQAAANVGGEFVRIADGRTPWQVFHDVRFLGNSRIDPCSRVLKRELLNRWRDENTTAGTDINYVGIDWTESHRIERLAERSMPHLYRAPMCEKPYMTKAQMLNALKDEGIEPPMLYKLGFPHNNCGGFCVKAGQAQFALLHRTMPARYAAHEAHEEKFRAEVSPSVAIMKEVVRGETRPLTMKAFRERLESQLSFDDLAWGGCGCAID